LIKLSISVIKWAGADRLKGVRMSDTLIRHPPQKIAERVLKELFVPCAPRLTMGDHLMAQQLKGILGGDTISDIAREDILAALGNTTDQLAEWLSGDPKRVAHAIRLAYSKQSEEKDE
jgi:hypothetical protein